MIKKTIETRIRQEKQLNKFELWTSLLFLEVIFFARLSNGHRIFYWQNRKMIFRKFSDLQNIFFLVCLVSLKSITKYIGIYNKKS